MWKPVETAPRDGTWVLGWWPSLDHPIVVQWDKVDPRSIIARDGWADGSDGINLPVTHWMPSPDLPVITIVDHSPNEALAASA